MWSVVSIPVLEGERVRGGGGAGRDEVRHAAAPARRLHARRARARLRARPARARP